MSSFLEIPVVVKLGINWNLTSVRFETWFEVKAFILNEENQLKLS